MPAFIDLTGYTFGYLTVLGIDPAPNTRKNQSKCWLCQCQCGRTISISSQTLRDPRKPTRSCGCLHIEVQRARHMTHGASRTPTYKAWRGMIDRCTNPHKQGWERYGGRGITVCEQWLHSFETFLADVGERPSPRHTLDRFPDNNGNYEPGNVRWATRQDQSRNTRSTVFLTWRGETHCITEWAEILEVSRYTLLGRHRRGLSPEEILGTPIDARFRNIRYKQ